MTLAILAWLWSGPAATARHHGIDPWLVGALAWHESRLRSDRVSRAGARGVMQVMPSWARPGRLCAGLDLGKAGDNVECACRLLARGLRECATPLLAVGWYHCGRCAETGHARRVVATWKRITRRTTT